LESLGPKFLTLHGPSLSLFLTVLFFAILVARARVNSSYSHIVTYCQIAGSPSFIMTYTYDFRYDPFSFVRVYSMAYDGPEDRRSTCRPNVWTYC